LKRNVTIAAQVIIIVMLMAACGGGVKPEQSPSPAPSSQASATPSGTGPSSTPVGEEPAADDHRFAYGFNVYARGDDDGDGFNQQTIQMVKGAGFNWVRIPIHWSDVERAKDHWDPLPLDRIVDQYGGSGVKILATVSKEPEWARDPSGQHLLRDFQDFAGFMHFLAERYKGKIHAYEIWNEENLATNMGGAVRIEDYGRLLEAGYQGAKQADPNITVAFGGLTPTGVNDPAIAMDDLQYLQAFYNFAGGAYTKYFDVLGIHVSSTHNPPDKMYPDNPGTGEWTDHPSFYFRRGEQLHQVMVEHGDTRPVWITEFGWTTNNGAPGYEYGALNTEQDQADYLAGAFEIARNSWPWTTGMFVWNLNYSVVSPPDDEKFPWSVINPDWSARPAYDKLKAMPKS
jgi:hypothetical protein